MRNQTTAAATIPGPYGLYLGGHVGAIWLVWVKELFWLLPYMRTLWQVHEKSVKTRGFHISAC